MSAWQDKEVLYAVKAAGLYIGPTFRGVEMTQERTGPVTRG